MGLRVWNSSAFVNATGFSVAANSSSWTNASAVAVWTSTFWKQFFPDVGFANDTVSSSGSGTQQATVHFLANGAIILESTSLGNTAAQNWVNPVGYVGAGTYEVYATVTGDPLSIGVTDSWLSLTTDRRWRISSTALEAPVNTDLVIKVRNADISNTEINQATFTMFAERV